VKHVTGIPHNPTGQALVERAHQIIKSCLEKQKEADVAEPQLRLSKVLFTLNFLSLTAERQVPPVALH
ncbi:IGEB protein, partial [Sclerurus mexicanus]|nr:IGEB protein [Sclerurus mexicanus]